MKLYIPAIGDELKLTSDWTFQLYNENRNFSLMEYLKDPRYDREDPYGYESVQQIKSLPATIPAGAILKVDRIYIRRGLSDYDSITFFWKGVAVPAHTEEQKKYHSYDTLRKEWTKEMVTVKVPKKPVRFWVKLQEANNIEFEKNED